jgi:hypothetical protein
MLGLKSEKEQDSVTLSSEESQEALGSPPLSKVDRFVEERKLLSVNSPDSLGGTSERRLGGVSACSCIRAERFLERGMFLRWPSSRNPKADLKLNDFAVGSQDEAIIASLLVEDYYEKNMRFLNDYKAGEERLSANRRRE